MYRLNSVPAEVRSLPILQSASGSIASFNTDLTENLVEVECEIVYQQASGTPSPSNPLPITTYTSLNLSHSGSDTSNPTVTNIPFGQTVAKGNLNVTTGVLEIEWLSVDMGNLNWSYSSVQEWFQTSKPTGAKTVNDMGLLCSCYFNNSTIASQDLTIFQTANNLRVNDSNYTDANVFKTSVTGQTIVYELATHTIIQLSSNQITALLNENNIWCDTGDTSVKFWMTINKYIGQ